MMSEFFHDGIVVMIHDYGADSLLFSSVWGVLYYCIYCHA